MKLDLGRRARRVTCVPSADARRRGMRRTPAVEALECRQLLSDSGTRLPNRAAAHTAGGASFQIVVSGPGAVTTSPIGHGQVAINLLGTTQDSQVTVTPLSIRPRYIGNRLQIGRLSVLSGQLGSFQALNSADLVGPMSPLNGTVQSLQFNALGGSEQIQANGTLGQLQVAGDATLPAGGGILVNGPVSVGGNLVDNGGKLNATSLSVGGSLVVAKNRVELGNAGPLTVGKDLDVTSGGVLHVAGDRTTAISVGGDLNLDNGQLLIDRNLSGAFSVVGTAFLQHGGTLDVGRDVIGGSAGANGLLIQGDLLLGTGGAINIGRNLAALTVGGNIDTTGGQINVGGTVNSLAVSGFILGKRSNDITVGLDLNNFQVLGGGANLGGLRSVDVNVGKVLSGLSISHGIFNSLITAGVAINGTGGQVPAGSSNIGPDGPTAIFDSTLQAGVSITNLIISGDVKSDMPTNPARIPTRIVAGVDRQGNLAIDGTIDNFQIQGTLIDAVVAAGVLPNGGNGKIRLTPPPLPLAPGDGGANTYDAPAGRIVGGQVGAPVIFNNFTAPPYNAAVDPTIDDLVLPGSINASFAPPQRAALPAPDPQTALPLPTKTTATGGVISTAHGDEADFAGFFAFNTRGVFVGLLPGTTTTG